MTQPTSRFYRSPPSQPRLYNRRILSALSLVMCVIIGLVAHTGPAMSQLKIASDGSNHASTATVERASPYTLTTQDGTGLKLVALDARTVVDGPLAFTELKLTFLNPHARQIEGRFEVTMPDRAALSRFAMKIRGAWMEGEVVEKQAARRAYEDALHRRQDPALLEQDAGNQFRARVFPIAPHERKELIISWSQELSNARERYRLPLVGLPEIEQLSLSALIAKPQARAQKGGVKSSLGGAQSRYEVTQITKRDFTPDQDWTLSGGETTSIVGLRSGNIALARVEIPDTALRESAQPHMVILFDTSASSMIGFAARLKELKAFASRLGEIGVERLSVIAFDQDAQVIFEGAPRALGAETLTRLKERDALGASNLSVGLEALKTTLDVKSSSGRRLLVMSDGVFTDGPAKPAELRALLKRDLEGLGVERIDASVDQSARDLIALEALVTTPGFNAGKVLTRDMSADERIRRLKLSALDSLKVKVPSAKWTWPSELKGMQPGDQALIFADLPEHAPLKVELSDSQLAHPFTFNIEAGSADPDLLKRAWVRARIERLANKMESPDPDMRGVWRDQIIKLSTKHRVLSPYTALLVLESEAMYKRFGIKRRALSDILTVGPMGIKALKRDRLVIANVAPAKLKPRTRRALKVKTMPRRQSARGGARAQRADSSTIQSRDDDAVDDDSSADAMPEALEVEEERESAPRANEAPRSRRIARVRTGGVPARSARRSPTSAEPPPPPGVSRPRTAPSATSSSLQARRASRSRSRRSSSRSSRSSRRSRRARALKQRSTPALTGEMSQIESLIKSGKFKRALKRARAWRRSEPTNLLTLIALGQALRANGATAQAARAFGSVIDFYPSRADMRRLAGNWLEWLGSAGMKLAESTYRVAAEQRPDHPSVYHMRAMTLVRLERFEEALKVVSRGIRAKRARNRFSGVDRVLREDAILIATAWYHRAPKRQAEIKSILNEAGIQEDIHTKTVPTMRFILTWETDANDVDFHIYDAEGGHASYRQKHLKSGGDLYADITTGYGPECFTISRPQAGPYKLQAHYYRRGPMGYGAGKLQVLRHDGAGELSFEERPFVIMVDGAYLDLGTAK